MAKELTLDLGNNVTMRLALVPAGKFLMGSPKDERERAADETQHEVAISKPFHMGIHTVTQEQYKQVMGKNPSHFKGAKNPVETVSWVDAAEFCKNLSQTTGKTLVPPTEAQWEYACRAGTTTPFNTGEIINTAQANYCGNHVYGNGQKGKYREATVAVGSFKPNAFGLYDMHGNLWQWCADWHGEDYYVNSPKTDPPGPATGQSRVLRGGSWNLHPRYCRSAFRGWVEPDLRSFYIGFRVVALPG